MFRVARSTRDRLALRLTSRVLATLALGACAHGRGAVAPPALAVATLRSSTGTTIGTATLRQVDGAIQVDLDVRGIADGAHGVHFHTVGRCDAPDFATAGGHLNPKGTKHGAKNPAGPHAGDLPNLIISGGRSSGWTAKTLRIAADASPGGLFDADGTAIVVHAMPDDEMTDPSGSSGARIACGVIEKR
ncbi:MAG: superoxide dismutase family protein [Gemmatimonadaceae bacterium]|jgi:Cu-Zn family superoxide dismutase|nr:superoxide dismutase family protein [Gemmatimonadota bacterium]MBK8061480.1 superoxide dismutase family protein [Gemmatimonadota bacterium]MBK9408978.1 superoxide dismutase family protein [Gemmatimonadota bacterium]MBK9979402.1 superoxide dismutase family protein [Gemmatimonadota bacterium]MCC7323205.1 superoxide dismutase family protein [Gemmatimonadaceae bacterium]